MIAVRVTLRLAASDPNLTAWLLALLLVWLLGGVIVFAFWRAR